MAQADIDSTPHPPTAQDCPTAPGASRRGILAGVAAALATGAAVNAAALVKLNGAEPDPVFDLIEQHRAAWRLQLAALERHSEVEESIKPHPPFWAYHTDPVPPGTDPAYIKACLDHRAACEASEDIALQLVNVQSTTIAGLIALLRYSVEFEIAEDCWTDTFAGSIQEDGDEDERPWHVWLQLHVADALEALVAS